MSTTKFANVKKSSLVILYSLYSLVLTQAWVLRFGDQGSGGGGAQSPALFYYLVATYSLMLTLPLNFH